MSSQSRTRALPAAQLVWEALDYPCAERLHPVLLSTAERLATHGELFLTPEVRTALANISRPTLERRMRQWSSPKAKRKARAPYQRLKEAGVLVKPAELLREEQLASLNPLQPHRDLERLLAQGPSLPCTRDA